MNSKRQELFTAIRDKQPDRIARLLKANPELLEELDDQQVESAYAFITGYSPKKADAKSEKIAAFNMLSDAVDVIREREGNEEAATTVQTNTPATITVADDKTIIETEGQTTTVETSDGDARRPDGWQAAADAVEQTTGVDPTDKPAKTTGARGVLPDAFGNTVKGERICKNCGVKESETLKKNARYSFCKGYCVNCYNKVARGGENKSKDSELTVEQIEGRIAFFQDLLDKKRAQNTASSGAQSDTASTATETPVVSTENATAASSDAPQDSVRDVSEELVAVESDTSETATASE